MGRRLGESRGSLRLGALVGPGRPDDRQAGIFEALKRSRGIIPKGLNYFSFEKFAWRCHHILQQIFKSGQGG